MHRIHVFTMVVLIAAVLAACGGTSDESADDTPASTTSASNAEQTDTTVGGGDSGNEQTQTTVPAVSDVFDTAGGVGMVTVGAETWEFTLPEGHPVATCDADFFGGFVAGLTSGSADIAEPADWMSVALPGGDFTDPPTATVKLGPSGEAEWIADETIYEQYPDLPAGLGVTSFTIDGTTASGTATFFEQESMYQFTAGNGDLLVEDGTFTVTCVAE